MSMAFSLSFCTRIDEISTIFDFLWIKEKRGQNSAETQLFLRYNFVEQKSYLNKNRRASA